MSDAVPTFFASLNASLRRQRSVAHARMVASRHGLAVLIIALAPAIYWWPLLAGWLPDFMDTLTQQYMWRAEASRQIRAGVLPVWLPTQMNGVPLSANPQFLIWYPPMWPELLLHSPRVSGLFVLGHYALGGIGMYAAVWTLGRSRPAALLAGLGYAMGAVMVSRMPLPVHLFAMAWFPWMVLAAEAMRRGPRGVVWTALAGAMVFLAGSPQAAYYFAIGFALFWIVRCAGGGFPGWRAFVLRPLGAVVLVVLLCAVQLLPTLEYLAHTERSGLDEGRLVTGALAGEHLWKAFVGKTMGWGELEDVGRLYAPGVGLLLFLPFAFWRRRARASATGLMTMAAGCYLLGLAVLVPLWVKWLPGYAAFHEPARALLPTHGALVLVCGLGAARAAHLARAKRVPPWVPWAAIPVLMMGTVWLLPGIEREFAHPDRLDVPEEVAELLGEDRFFAVDPTLNYSYYSRRDDFGQSLVPNVASYHGLMDAQGYDPLVPARFGMVRRLAMGRSGVIYPSHGVFFTDPASPALDLLGVRYLVGRHDLFDVGRIIPGAGFDRRALAAQTKRVIEDERWPVYRYTEKRPMAWFARGVAFGSGGPEDAFTRAVSQQDVRATAFVEEPPNLALRPHTAEAHKQRKNARTMRIDWEAPPTNAALLVISTNWFPGWTARDADGDRLDTIVVNGFLLGVEVPAGTESVVVRYAPASQRDGALLSLLGLLLCAVVLSRTRHLGHLRSGD